MISSPQLDTAFFDDIIAIVIDAIWMDATGQTAAPDIFKLLADDLRWQIVTQLAHSDLRVQELTARTGRPQNLVSYHLRQLREHGLVTERRSSADGRDVYYTLDLDGLAVRLRESGQALHPILARANSESTASLPVAPAAGPCRTVLFVCTHNSARSQMAEGFVNNMTGSVVRAFSAGLHATQVHPLAEAVMAELGAPIAGQRSKTLAEFAGETFDLVVMVCDSAREACPAFAGAREQLHWSIADPAQATGAAAELHAVFMQTAQQIRRRVEHLLAYLAATVSYPH